jgi:hypothetical protein
VIPTPYKIAGAAIAIILLVAGALWYVSAERAKAYAAGEASERAKWQEREAKELAAANAALVAAQERAAAIQRQADDELAALDAEHQKELQHVQADHDRFVDDDFAGRVRVRGDIRAAACEGAARGTSPAAAAPAGGGDGAAAAGLPDALSRAVARGDALAAEADEVVLQLTACQGVVRSYLKACNAPQ